METNLRKDDYFVQDKNWYKQNDRYNRFIEKTKNENVMLLELGVGFNTPKIIRFPFEEMVQQNSSWNLVRVNKDNCNTLFDIEDRSIVIKGNIKEVIKEIYQ